MGQLAVSLVRDARGRALHTVAITRDITERKRLEESLREIRNAERRRIARDLHDVVLQDLAGALQGLQATRMELESSGRGIDLEQEIVALRGAVGSLRNAIYDLRLEKDQPFVKSVESLVELNRQLTPEREIRLEVCDGFRPSSPAPRTWSCCACSRKPRQRPPPLRRAPRRRGPLRGSLRGAGRGRRRRGGLRSCIGQGGSGARVCASGSPRWR